MTPYPNRDAFEDVCEALERLRERVEFVRDYVHRLGTAEIVALFETPSKKAQAALARARNEKETG